jgi:hypothetical protein
MRRVPADVSGVMETGSEHFLPFLNPMGLFVY